ncbi:MAG: alpha/beta fold hydrolase [Stanieria sp.]
MSITEHKIQVGKLEWFYRLAEAKSDNPPVLLLHGLPAHSYTWRKIMPELAQTGSTAIAPDWIGCGFSAKPDKRDFAYTPDAFIDALADFIAALELTSFHLVVQGFLASVGLQYALRHPEQIERLIILNTPIATTAKLPWKMKQWGFPFVGDMATQDPLLVDRTLEGGSGFVISDQDLDVLRKPFLQTSSVGRALVAIINRMALEKSMNEIATGLSTWEKPACLIWGMLDPWLSAEDAEALAANSSLELLKLAEAKHYPQEHWSQEIAEKISYFFRREVF